MTLGPGESPTARDEFRYGPDGGRYYRKVTWQEETTDPDTEETTTRTRTAHVYRVGGYERVVGDTHAAHAVVEKTRAGAALQVSLRETSSSTPAAAFEYLHTDHLGTTAAATDATGASLLALAHDPYGTRRKADWTAQLPESDVSAIAAGQDAGRTRRTGARGPHSRATSNSTGRASCTWAGGCTTRGPAGSRVRTRWCRSRGRGSPGTSTATSATAR